MGWIFFWLLLCWLPLIISECQKEDKRSYAERLNDIEKKVDRLLEEKIL